MSSLVFHVKPSSSPFMEKEHCERVPSSKRHYEDVFLKKATPLLLSQSVLMNNDEAKRREEAIEKMIKASQPFLRLMCGSTMALALSPLVATVITNPFILILYVLATIGTFAVSLLLLKLKTKKTRALQVEQKQHAGLSIKQDEDMSLMLSTISKYSLHDDVKDALVALYDKLSQKDISRQNASEFLLCLKDLERGCVLEEAKQKLLNSTEKKNMNSLVFVIPCSSKPPKETVVLEDANIVLDSAEEEFLAEYQNLVALNDHEVLSQEEIDHLWQVLDRAGKKALVCPVFSMLMFVAGFVLAVFLPPWLGGIGFAACLGITAYLFFQVPKRWEKIEEVSYNKIRKHSPCSKKQEEEVSFLLYDLIEKNNLHSCMKEAFFDLNQKIQEKKANQGFVNDGLTLLKKLQKFYHLQKARSVVSQKLSNASSEAS